VKCLKLIDELLIMHMWHLHWLIWYCLSKGTQNLWSLICLNTKNWL